MRGYRFVSVCLMLLLSLSMFVNFVAQANATLRGDNFVTEITTAPTGIDVVDVDSQGRLFCIANNDIYRSLDQGATWAKVKDNSDLTGGVGLCIFVDSRDYVFAVTEDDVYHGTFNIQRSIDNGDTWTEEHSRGTKLWEMDEMSNGSLSVNTYHTNKNWILKSDDSGDTWSVFYNFTANSWNIDHIHAVGIDDYNDDIYIVTGDGRYQSGVWRWNSTSDAWDEIANSTTTVPVEWQFTKIMFDENYVYFLADGQSISYRMDKSGTSISDMRAIHDLRWGGRINTNFVFADFRVDDTYLFGTDEGQIWGSWDGEHWVKIYDLGDGKTFRQFTNRRPIFVTDSETNKLYRVDVQKEDIIQLYYAQHNQYRGSLTNAQSYVLEQRLWNGTNYLDLTQVGLSSVQASIKGLCRVNQAPSGNSGFELNSTSGWTIGGSPTGSTTSTEKANGTYCYTVQKSVGDSANTILYPTGYLSGSQGDIYVISFYHKANASVAQAFSLFFFNGSGNTKKQQDLTSQTSWKRFTVWHTLDSASSSARWVLHLNKKDVTHYLDSVMVLKLEVGQGRWQASGESYSNFESFSSVRGTRTVDSGYGYNPLSYFDGTQNTSNPTLTISGQVVSHSGTLTNGTESSATSLTGILTGAVQISAVIQGSGQAILKITGTRELYEDSIILQGRTSNVYYGRYYGTLSLSTTTSDLIALTNLQANITSLLYNSDKLTLTLDSPSETTSTTEVYVGDKGKPIAIYTANETLTWSYNAYTTILTFNVTHTSPTRILVYWKFPGDIDGDGDVDIEDLYIFAVAYGSHVGDPTYNSDSDINGDGDIDADDLYIYVENYGKTNP